MIYKDNHLGYSKICNELRKKGYHIKQINNRYTEEHIDLIINKKKIQLKTSNIGRITKTKRGKKYFYKGYIFRIKKEHAWNKYENVDYILCCGFDEKDNITYWVIPIEDVVFLKCDLHFLMRNPNGANRKNKWDIYKNKLSLLRSNFIYIL